MKNLIRLLLLERALRMRNIDVPHRHFEVCQIFSRKLLPDNTIANKYMHLVFEKSFRICIRHLLDRLLDRKPSAIYNFFSKLKWAPENLFQPILKECLPYFEKGYIAVGVDDSKYKKTGKKIPFTGWHRDPMSPKFHVNLMGGASVFTIFCPIATLRTLWSAL